MFFEKELLSFNILDVIKLKQNNINMFCSGRNFDALSFRISADTVLKTENSEYRARDNSVCFFPAGINYTRICSRDEMIVIHMNLLNNISNDIEYFTPSHPEVLAELFYKISDCWNGKEIGYKYKCSAILYEIFEQCYVQNYKSDEESSKIEKAVAFIKENYKRADISIGEAAEKSFMSEVYFRKLFKSEFGISPQKYIINLKIQNAVSLMADGYYSLKEIADMVGYNDYKYFSTQFKKIKGVSPSEYVYNYNNIKNKGLL